MRGTPKQPHHHNKFASGYLAMTIAFIFLPCSQKQEEQKASLLSDFWKKEIARLNKEKPMITKISTVNGKTDTIRTDSIDWEKELQVFVKSDIQEKDLGMFNVDTITVHDTVSIPNEEGYLDCNVSESKVIKLISKNKDSKIRELMFRKDLTYIVIVIIDEEQLYGINKRLIYSTHGRYEIKGSQDVKFLNGINYKVQVKFER